MRSLDIKKHITTGKINISAVLSLFAAAFYMLVFYKTQNYSNYRSLSYGLAFSIMLVLDIYILTAFFFQLKDEELSLKKAVFFASAALNGLILLISFDWIFSINLYADKNIYKKILIALQFVQLFMMIPFTVFPSFKGGSGNSDSKTSLHSFDGSRGRSASGGSASENEKNMLFLSAVLYLFAVLFFFSPVRLYTSAPGEVEAEISRILFKNASVILIGTALFSFLFRLLKGSMSGLKNLILKTAVYTALCSFFFSFILGISYGALDNYILTNSAALYRGFLKNIIEISALILSAYAVGMLVRKKSRLLRNVFLILLAVGTAQSVLSLVNMRGYDEKKVTGNPVSGFLPEYNSDLMGYSKNGNNIVVILLDMFSGGYIPEMLEDMPELNNNLSGFTWYPNTLTAGYNTSSSVPGMYGGWSYIPSSINEKDYDGYIVDQIIESYEVLPRILEKYNYKTSYTDPDYYRTPHGNIDELKKIGITAGFNQDYLPYWKSKNINASEIKNEKNPEKKAAKYLFAVSLFKASPLLLKPVIYNEGDWFLIGGSEVKNNAYKFALKSWAFMDLLDEVSNTDAESNTFKYFHNYITHEPFAMSSEGKPVLGYPDKEAGDNLHGKNAYYSAKSAMIAVSDWIDWLKKNNVYNNTKIIIVADHGNDVADNPMKKEGFSVEGLTDKEFNRAQIMLMVKDFNADGNLETDSRFMSNADIPAIILSSLNNRTSYAESSAVISGASDSETAAAGSRSTGSENVKSDISYQEDIYNGTSYPEDLISGKPFPADPTKGEAFSRTLRTVKSDSWRWEYITKNRKFKYKWVYDVRDNLFDDKNWTKVE